MRSHSLSTTGIAPSGLHGLLQAEPQRLGVLWSARLYSRPMALTQPTSHTTPPLEALAGTVERVTYHNAENGFAILEVQTRGKRDLITVVGHAASVMEGEWITASGSWVSDRTHGLQFRAKTLSTTPPTGAQAIEKYLGSGQMRGIGPAMAKRIVAAFGEATFD